MEGRQLSTSLSEALGVQLKHSLCIACYGARGAVYERRAPLMGLLERFLLFDINTQIPKIYTKPGVYTKGGVFNRGYLFGCI